MMKHKNNILNIPLKIKMHGKLFLSLVSKIPHICLIHTYSLLVTFTFVKYYGSDYLSNGNYEIFHTLT